MSDMPLRNFITFQIWALFVFVGAMFSILLWSLLPLIISPWFGCFIGVALNSLLPGYVNEGIRIVNPDSE